MNAIKLFLGQYKNLTSSDLVIKRGLVNVVKKTTGFDLPLTDIQVSKLVVYIKTKPALKSEIFIKRDLIISELKKILSVDSTRVV